MGVGKKYFMGSPPAYLRDGSGSPDSVLTGTSITVKKFVFLFLIKPVLLTKMEK